MYVYMSVLVSGDQKSVPDLPKLERHMLGTEPCSPEQSSKPSQPLSHLLRPCKLTISSPPPSLPVVFCPSF